MSRLFAFIVIATSFSAPALAQSILRVRLADNSQLSISVDGRYFNRRGTSITVGDLPAGIHSLRIYGTTVYRGRGYQEVIYKGRVRTDEGMVTNFTYDPYGGSSQTQQVEMSQDAYARSNNGTRAGSVPPGIPRNYDQPMQDKGTGHEISPAAEPEAPVTKQDNRPAASPVIVDEGTMTEARISKLKAKVTAKGTDTEKLKAIKDGLQNEKITTYQVSVMMDWFTFENTRLEFAKWAYDITLDKDHFGDLGAKFTYKNSEEDLKRFLQSK